MTRNGLGHAGALRRRFERAVDPHGTMAPAERAQRADAALKAYMLRLSQLGAQAHRRRQAAAELAVAALRAERQRQTS
jgi:hypothetical protein